MSTRVTRAEVFGKVAVLYGGQSAEREISLQSGEAVLAGLRRGGVDAHGVDRGDNVIADIEDGGFDRVFIALHGRGGEDGVIQGALEVLGVPFTGSGVLGSALAMDKRCCKLVWQASGVPTPAFRMISSEQSLRAAAADLGFPMAVKPVHEGSSIGIAKAANDEEMHRAWWAARAYDTQILAEPWLDGAEYTAAIVDREVLPIIKLETPRTFYDYEAKYSDDSDTRYLCPCGLDQSTEAEFARIALRAFDAVGASGWGRVDFVCDTHGSPFFIDVNTVPGMTSHSLVPMAAKASSVGFDALVWRILETSLYRGEVADRETSHARARVSGGR